MAWVVSRPDGQRLDGGLQMRADFAESRRYYRGALRGVGGMVLVYGKDFISMWTLLFLWLRNVCS